MSQNTHTGISPRRSPVNTTNVKKRVQENLDTIKFLQARDAKDKKKK